MTQSRKWKIAAINFEHFHMGDNLRMAVEHPQVEIVGLFDEKRERIEPIIEKLGLPSSLIYDNDQQLLDETKPDLVLLCPAAARHGEWVQRVARENLWLLIEKPFAASLDEAKSMIDIAEKNRMTLAINWPLTWVATHRAAYRMAVEEGVVGTLIGVNYYGGNRGPLWHTFDKIHRTQEDVDREKPASWFYKKSLGGGSLLDYLGYGATLGTWYMQGKAPLEVISVVDRPLGLEVDEHSITVCRYDVGLSRMETRWGTFNDPWVHPNQPRCGFTLIGTKGTIHSEDYAASLRIQTEERREPYQIEIAALEAPYCNPIQYIIHCMNTGTKVEGPLSVAISWTGQRIVDTAYQSSLEGKTLSLLT